MRLRLLSLSSLSSAAATMRGIAEGAPIARRSAIHAAPAEVSRRTLRAERGQSLQIDIDIDMALRAILPGFRWLANHESSPEGAAYHVMSRGNRGADIFVDDRAFMCQSPRTENRPKVAQLAPRRWMAATGFDVNRAFWPRFLALQSTKSATFKLMRDFN